MNRSVRKISLPFLMAFLTFGSFMAFAQEELRYQGPLKVGKYEGEADYGYKIVDGDTLLDGAFQIQRSNLESLLEKEDYSFLFTGTFNNNYPTDRWNFQFAEYQSNRRSQVVDYQYRVLVSGIQEDASGTIRNGKPHDSWTYTVNQIKDSEVEKLLFKSSIDFENGVPQRSFRIENETSTLVGRFLRNGLAHDQWSLFSTNGIDAEENWFFDDGLLQQIQVNQNDSAQTITVYGNDVGQTKTIQLGLQYINALKLHLATRTESAVFPEGIQTMLAENATYYQKIDDILKELGQSDFAPKFKVKVPYYALDSLEIIQLKKTKTLFKSSKKISDAFLNDTQLNILKLSDDEAFFQYEVIKAITENFLNPAQSMLDYEKQGILEFIPRERLIAKLWPQGMPSKNIEVTTDSTGSKRTFLLPNADQFDLGGEDIASIMRTLEYANGSLDTLQKVLNERLTKEQRQQELIALEEKLILQNKKLNELIDTANDDPSISVSAKEALEQIKLYEDQKLAEYSAIREVEQRLSYAGQLVACYEKLQALAESVSALPSRWQTIQDNYQDRVWNPFMATLMDEEVKKRITTAYRKVLVPYFLERIKSGPSCESADTLVDQMKGSYQRILQLRGEDTSKLERKLRKEQDPQVVMQLFNLQATDQN